MRRKIRVPMHGRAASKVMKFIKRGMRWRIGDGSCVKIYQDHWLPSSNHGKVFSLVVDIPMDATVDILIDQDLRC